MKFMVKISISFLAVNEVTELVPSFACLNLKVRGKEMHFTISFLLFLVACALKTTRCVRTKWCDTKHDGSWQVFG